MKPVVFTPGEPAGIGPDLTVALANETLPCEVVVVADGDMLAARAEKLKKLFSIESYNPKLKPTPTLKLISVAAANPRGSGVPDVSNVPYVLETLKMAAQGCLQGKFAAMVTGPVHKGVINEAGIAFQGHTEFLAKLAGVTQTLMCFQTEGLRVALATVHVPLAKVANMITQPHLHATLKLLHGELQAKFGINDPRIAVCGLNPHAGEQGYLGREEIEVITPVIKELAAGGMKVFGPFPADTVFAHSTAESYHCILAMYHDQGLPVVKLKGFYQSANITLGLPFIRTSVDHGTACDIAGSGKANPGSLKMALAIAIDLAKRSPSSL